METKGHEIPEVSELPEMTAETIDFSASVVRELITKIEDRQITLSATSIKEFMKSPRHFIAYKLRQKAKTKAMDEGSYLDCLLFTPKNEDREYAVLPPGANMASHKGVTRYLEVYGAIDYAPENMKLPDRKAVLRSVIEASGKTEIQYATASMLRKAARIIRMNGAAKYILEGERDFQKEIEFSAFDWNWKGKIDIYAESFIADGKLMAMLDLRAARRTVEYEYLPQAALYMFGPPEHDQSRFHWLCYDRAGNTIVLEEDRKRLSLVWDEIGEYMDHFERCLAFNLWHQSFDFWVRGGIHKLRQ